MFDWLTPARRRGAEILDDPATPDALRRRAMADVERSNVLFGGSRAVRREVRRLPPLPDRGGVLLDVGTGRGDIAAGVARDGARRGARVWTIGLDRSEALARDARHRLDAVVVGDALRLPFRDASADLVVCSQVLHHLFDGDLRQGVTELNRVSGGWVIVADLRRSLVAALGFWLASFVFRFHWATRLDGVTSVLRGFTARELAPLVERLTGRQVTVRRHAFWRLTVAWRAGDPRGG